MRIAGLFAFLALLLAGCAAEEGPVLDIADLNGEWGYKWGQFAGAGLSCTSRPATGWAARGARQGDTTLYALSVEKLTMICSHSGGGPDTVDLGIDDNNRVMILSLAVTDSGSIVGCPLPGYTWTDGIALLVGGTCDPEVTVEGNEITFEATLQLAYPDPSAEPSALTGPITLTRR